MALLESVNIGALRPAVSDLGVSAIDRRPAGRPVMVRAPGPKGIGGSGLVGDQIGDLRHHGGDEAAAYAYAREDLDWWQERLGVELASGVFGENLTTVGLDVTGARTGELWRVGEDVLMQVTSPRIPCRTFAAWMEQRGWVRTFTERAHPGAYLRIVEPGWISAGDPITLEWRPDHEVTIGLIFRALTIDDELLPLLLAAEQLPEWIRDGVERRLAFRARARP